MRLIPSILNFTGFLTLICTIAHASGDRPNILFLFADDWGQHASIYAEVNGEGTVNDALETPHFDKLAKDGVLFKNSYVNAPSCTPCRSSLLSGQHFWRTEMGAVLQGAVWDVKIPTYPLLLEDSGYHIGHTHKVWSPGTERNAPYGAKRTAYNQGGGNFNNFSQFVTQQVANEKSVAEAKEILMEQTRASFRQFLKDRKPGEPFCYWFGPTNVHRKWIKGSGKALWGLDPDKLKGKMPPFLPDVHPVREDLNDYFGEVMGFDMAIGVFVEELKRIGEYENTLIAISGDHGAPGFPHGKCNLYDFGSRVALMLAGPGVKGGRVVDDFVSLPDLAPTFLEAGKVAIPDTMTGKSIWPVLRSSAEGMVDPSRTHVFIGRERHVRKARAGNLPYPQRAIRTKDYLLIINFKPDRYPLGDPYNLGTDKEPTVEEMEQNTFGTLPDEDAGPAKAWLVSNRNNPKWQTYFNHAYGKRPQYELFKIADDPHQMSNLASDPEYREVLERLKKQLINELESTGDPRMVDGGSFFEEVDKLDN
ncbi:MAG: sulfatase [Puniceicoccaceae bacterium]